MNVEQRPPAEQVKPTWAMSSPLGCYHILHPPLPYLVLLSLKADTRFAVPQTVNG